MHYKRYHLITHVRGLQFICSAITSPVNLCLTLATLFCIVKIIWLALDPFNNYQRISRIAERVLAEIVYSILFAIYAILLIVWYSLYDEISFSIIKENKRRLIYKTFKFILKVRIFIVFLLQITVSVIKGYRKIGDYRYAAYPIYGFLYVNFLVFILEFSIYGVALYRCIEQ